MIVLGIIFIKLLAIFHVFRNLTSISSSSTGGSISSPSPSGLSASSASTGVSSSFSTSFSLSLISKSSNIIYIT